MDGDALLTAVRTATEMELSRLGSEKLLIAATDATLEAEAIAAALRADLVSARALLERWADDADSDELGSALADVAADLEGIEAAVAGEWPEVEPEGDGLLGDLRAPASDLGRAGAGLLGFPLVLDRLVLQAVSFHVNEANTADADRLRTAREDVAAIRDEAADQLADAATDTDEVAAGAIAAIESAYDTYASRLGAMGLDPKPIC